MDKYKSLLIIIKKFLSILALSLCFISTSKADDIRSFEIEGMSVGDSLLEFFSKKEIKDEIVNATFYPNSKKFMIISLIPKKLENYENINFHIKLNDKKYLIYSVKGLSKMETEKCLKLKKSVVTDIETLVPNARLNKYKDDYNKSMGNSEAYINDYFISDGVIRVFCTNWDKEFLKKKENLVYRNTLTVSASNDKLVNWMKKEAY